MANVYSSAERAKVLSEWMAGASLNQLARDNGIPKSTVQRWVDGQKRVIAQSTGPKKDVPVYDLDDMALKLVDGSVNAVTHILGVTQDDAWLKRQNAADLAVFAGVISDKLYRLLGAIQPVSSTKPPLVTSGFGDTGQ